MIPYRLRRLLLFPFAVVFARLKPVAYARRIGVRMKGRVTIYGSRADGAGLNGDSL